MQKSVSIIISTHNRAESLRETLASLDSLRTPPEAAVELVVVNNGSTDATEEVLRTCTPGRLPCTSIREARPGKSVAINRAISVAEGDVLLFTDDDVRVPPRWIGGMAGPIWSGEAAAVAGGVQLASHLERPWMEMLHRSTLAETRALDPETPERLVGANMAVARRVFDHVPGLDPELGPGPESLGLGEDTLLAGQIRAAGFRIASAFDVVVTHHLDPDRLEYAAFERAMQKIGASQAYVEYHWHHGQVSRVRSALALGMWTLCLQAFRWTHRAGLNGAEGMDVREMQLRRRIAYHRELLRQMQGPPAYPTMGLRRRSAGDGEPALPDAPGEAAAAAM